jgi:DinB superfamily
MTEAVTRLELILKNAPKRLVDISEDDAGHKPDPAHWSKKEILGHLIDSAANNHQRFIRAQFVPLLEIASYEQEAWVKANGYASEQWPDLVNLWLLLNRHLLHVMKAIPEAALQNRISLAGSPPETLYAVIVDYIRHMDHHLGQIFAS